MFGFWFCFKFILCTHILFSRYEDTSDELRNKPIWLLLWLIITILRLPLKAYCLYKLLPMIKYLIINF